MTVKVVRGLVQTVKPATASQNAGNENRTGGLASRVSSANPVASEAAVTAVRASRGTQDTEKVRDSKEARSLAKSVAQEIFMNEADAAAAHSGLSSSSAQGIL